MTTAKPKAITRPCEPPSRSPIASRSPLRRPSSRTVFRELFIYQLDERQVTAVSKASGYRTRYNVRMRRVGFTIIVVFAAGWLQLAAQTPQPFPGRPAPPRPSPAPPKTATPPPTTTPAAPEPPAVPKPAPPTEAVLGFPIYPNAQFIATYDAGRGQQYHLFGSEMPFA